MLYIYTMKTNRDINGNYTGNYKGLDFIIYNFPEGWVFNIDFWSKLMCQKLSYDSRQDGVLPFKTKKYCINILQETIDNNEYL